jgi:hypothetical protein
MGSFSRDKQPLTLFPVDRFSLNTGLVRAERVECVLAEPPTRDKTHIIMDAPLRHDIRPLDSTRSTLVHPDQKQLSEESSCPRWLKTASPLGFGLR